MDFFEALLKIALDKWASKSNDEDTNYGWSPRAGIEATIEALKEMMVGEPMTVWATWGKHHDITHFWDVQQPGNLFDLTDGGGTRFILYAFALELTTKG